MKLKTLVLISLITLTTAVKAENDTFKFFLVKKNAPQKFSDSKKYYEDFLSDCLSLAKSNAHSEAEQACSKAIRSAKSEFSINSTKAMAYAYNNRAVVRVLANNKVGALDDLRKANSYQELELIQSNLTMLTEQINQIN